MRRAPAGSLHDRQASLVTQRHEMEAEIARLAREEEYLHRQVREAAEQVRYYESLLTTLRRHWGERESLAKLVRRLG